MNNPTQQIERPGNTQLDEPETLVGKWHEGYFGINLTVKNDRVLGFIEFRGTKRHITYRVTVGAVAEYSRHLGTYCTLRDAKAALLNATGIELDA